MDHSKASVRRYRGLSLSRVPAVPGHMTIDASTRELFVSDTGANRVLRIEIDSGRHAYDAKEQYPIYSSPESSFNYSVWEGLQWAVVGRVHRPSGIALSATTLYVASFDNGTVSAF